MVALDIGSHLGYYALALARIAGDSGHVYAFEPAPRHVKVLGAQSSWTICLRSPLSLWQLEIGRDSRH
jgi:hypothetical protein